MPEASAAAPAPEWDVAQWFNTEAPLTLGSLCGQVVALHTFQMLCPGCVVHGIPQAQRIESMFEGAPLQVVGLHTVFEHHDAMQPHALEAFLHEYRVTFPVGVDRPATEGDIPNTMRTYNLRGTPSLVLIDKAGRLRRNIFGRPEDLLVGAMIGTLLQEDSPISVTTSAPPSPETGICPADGDCT